MIRNLKALGLALAAVFAFSAMSASAASAQNGKLTSDGPVTLDGTELHGEGETNAFTAFEEEVHCPTTLTGHKYAVTPHELIPSGAETVTLTPDYNQALCKAGPIGGANHKATVTMEGCDYVLHLGETDVTKVDTYKTTVDIVCPPNKSIIIHVYFAEGNENIQVCEITVGPQVGLTGATATDETNEHLSVHGIYLGINTSKSGLCGSASTTEGEFHANFTVTGTNSLGESTEISLSHS